MDTTLAEAKYQSPDALKPQANLFIIGKNGSVQRLVDSAGMKPFFIANWKLAGVNPTLAPTAPVEGPMRAPLTPEGGTDVPAAHNHLMIAGSPQPIALAPSVLKTADGQDPKRDLIYTWLRLSTIYATGIPFMIRQQDIRVEIMQTASIGSVPHVILTGKAIPMQGYTGEISVSLSLDDKTGKIRNISEMRNLIPPPSVAAAPAEGNGPPAEAAGEVEVHECE